MADLPSSFIITLNGTPITKNTEVDEQQIHAKAEHSQPAVFTFNDGLLESDGWYLGRFLVEDRSLLPKRVLWHKKGGEYNEDMVHKTTIELEGGKYVVKNGGALLALFDDRVFGDLMQESPATVQIVKA